MAKGREKRTLIDMRRALIVFLLALGCSSSSEGGALSADESGSSEESGAVADTAASTDDATPASDSGSVDAYPAGPYGKTVGSVLADLSLAGYSRDETTGLATLATYGEASFGTLRAHAMVKYALIHVGGYT